MEYKGGQVPGSKKIGISYGILLLFPGAGTFLYMIGQKSIDPAISNLAYNISAETLTIAFGYLLPGIIPGLISWLLGKSALKEGNLKAKKLMKFSIVITCLFIFSQLFRGLL